MADIEWIEKGNDKIALKKSFDGWRIVYPYKNQDGSYNWKNIILGGSWWNMIKWLIILLMLLGFYYVYAHDTATCRQTLSELPNTINEYCSGVRDIANLEKDYNSNYSKLNLTFIEK